ncbi:hypothetical protein LCGC14_1536420 [marine sediment metagenome]|uniref:Organic solvent tolerance-like N-terminal domain-containing protein n=1 Tax=marine sediment metagenome TaxID=412755 RepID=A0A0F9IUG0_9ZZZZ
MSRAAVLLLIHHVSIMLASVAFAGEAKEGRMPSGPIVITSDSLHADGKEGTATFIGSVKAVGDDFNLKADRMKVFYAEGGSLRRIDAEGSVKLIREGRVVTSDHATYNAQERTLIFTGNARVVEEGNVLVGTKITYMIDEERYEVEGSKVFIENAGGKPRGVR